MKTILPEMKMLSVISISCLVTLLALTISPIQCEQSDLYQLPLQNPCVVKTSCRECIQTKACVWCMNPDFADKPKCFHPSSVSLYSSCGEQYIWDPDNAERIVIGRGLTRASSAMSSSSSGGGYVSGAYGSSSFSSSSSRKEESSSSSGFSASGGSSGSGSSHGSNSGSFSDSSSHIVQIYPQRVSLKLRASEFNFNCH